MIVRAEAVKESNHLVMYRAFGKNLKIKSGCCTAFTSWFSFSVRIEIQRKTAGIEENYTQASLSEEREGRNPMYKKSKIQL